MRMTPDEARKAEKVGKKKQAELSFVRYLNHHRITGWDRQTRFAPPRWWQFDFAWIRERVAVEIEGITYFGLKQGYVGRHQSPEGFAKDCEKYNAALLLGWRVYRVPHVWVIKGGQEIWTPHIAEDLRKLLGIENTASPAGADTERGR